MHIFALTILILSINFKVFQLIINQWAEYSVENLSSTLKEKQEQIPEEYRIKLNNLCCLTYKTVDPFTCQTKIFYSDLIYILLQIAKCFSIPHSFLIEESYTYLSLTFYISQYL